jgi:hypothetical protein
MMDLGRLVGIGRGLLGVEGSLPSWANKLDSWDFTFVGNVQKSEPKR